MSNPNHFKSSGLHNNQADYAFPIAKTCRGETGFSGQLTIMDAKNVVSTNISIRFPWWHRVCWTSQWRIEVDRILKFGLVYASGQCKKRRLIAAVDRKQLPQSSQKNCDQKMRNRAGARSSNRGRHAYHQPIHPEHGLDRILGTGYEAHVATNRGLRNCARQIAAISAAACVHVKYRHLIFSARGRATSSVTFFCHEKNIQN